MAIAKEIGCSQPYLSELPKKNNPSIPAAMLANFCLKYEQPLVWILTGENQEAKEKQLLRIIEKQEDQLGKFLEALIEVKGEWTDPLNQLINESQKKGNKQ